MANDQARVPAEVFPVWDFIKEELAERDMTAVELHLRLGWPLPEFHRLMQGSMSITPEAAAGLERVLGPSAQSWLNLDRAYWERKGAGEARPTWPPSSPAARCCPRDPWITYAAIAALVLLVLQAALLLYMAWSL
jgi:plasmid maintenance system antidote protein VapI